MDNQYFEDTYKNRRIMQRTLRELDLSMLAPAMVELSEKQRQFVYCNMSQRAKGLLEEAVKKSESEASEERVRAAYEFLMDIHGKIVEEMKNSSPHSPPPMEVDVRISTKEEIIGTMVALAKLAQSHGLFAIDRIDATADPLLAIGLRMIVDGTDPSIVDSILYRKKQTMLKEYNERLDMFIEGIVSLQSGDHPVIIGEKLKAFSIE